MENKRMLETFEQGFVKWWISESDAYGHGSNHPVSLREACWNHAWFRFSNFLFQGNSRA